MARTGAAGGRESEVKEPCHSETGERPSRDRKTTHTVRAVETIVTAFYSMGRFRALHLRLFRREVPRAGFTATQDDNLMSKLNCNPLPRFACP